MRWYRRFLLSEQPSNRLKWRSFGALFFCIGLLGTSWLWRTWRLETVQMEQADYLALRRWAATDTVLSEQLAVEGLLKLDLNQVNAVDLQTIPGIGKVLSRRIVLHRAALGGFHSLAQLQGVERFPAKLLPIMAEAYRVSRPYRRLAVPLLDTADSRRLASHPYMNADRVAGVLAWDLAARSHSIAGLRAALSSPSFGEDSIALLLPYFQFDKKTYE